MGENKFEPDSNLTRAQFMAMLAKIDGADMSAYSAAASAEGGEGATPVASAAFTDVTSADWFYAYVKWGVEKGITNGMGDGTFAPNAQITREQMAVMLLKYAQSIGFMLPQKTAIPTFTDAGLISSWSADYVYTAAAAGILSGFDTGEFAPQGSATRAQAAKVIYVFAQLRELF